MNGILNYVTYTKKLVPLWKRRYCYDIILYYIVLYYLWRCKRNVSLHHGKVTLQYGNVALHYGKVTLLTSFLCNAILNS